MQFAVDNQPGCNIDFGLNQMRSERLHYFLTSRGKDESDEQSKIPGSEF